MGEPWINDFGNDGNLGMNRIYKNEKKQCNLNSKLQKVELVLSFELSGERWVLSKQQENSSLKSQLVAST